MARSKGAKHNAKKKRREKARTAQSEPSEPAAKGDDSSSPSGSAVAGSPELPLSEETLFGASHSAANAIPSDTGPLISSSSSPNRHASTGRTKRKARLRLRIPPTIPECSEPESVAQESPTRESQAQDMINFELHQTALAKPSSASAPSSVPSASPQPASPPSTSAPPASATASAPTVDAPTASAPPASPPLASPSSPEAERAIRAVCQPCSLSPLPF